jgi:hypothetical protein
MTCSHLPAVSSSSPVARGRSRQSGLVPCVVFPLLWWCLVAQACSPSEDRCQQDVDAVASCDREFDTVMCDDDSWRCVVHCYAQLECSEFAAVDRDESPPRLGRCLARCQEQFSCGDDQSVPAAFVCDGVEDCADGNDEVKCKYFTCKSGQLVRETAACDKYAHCEDGSDEETCP